LNAISLRSVGRKVVGNRSKAICRTSNILREPSPDPGRSPKEPSPTPPQFMSATINITIETTVFAPVSEVWTHWISPDSIMQWNTALDTWHCPRATNDLRVGGSFSSRMEAKDGSIGFEFAGTYTEIREHSLIAYALEDDRKVVITFEPVTGGTKVSESFDAEDANSAEMQRSGWQSILDRFKAFVEAQP
jgi:uncharacterized protein YndB with AHSA1/START domain